MKNLKIKEVKSNTELNRFIKFPNELYQGNKYRVPQLHVYEKSTLRRDKNPAFDFCESKYWLAYAGDKIVGRIAALINHRSNLIWDENYMRFGWIDFIDDLAVSKALISKVEQWAIELNMEAVHGPLGTSDMDLEGMLVDGFDELGTQAVIYNHPYYQEHMDKLGYTKDVDWVQYEINVPDRVPEKIKRLSKLILEKYNLRILEAGRAKDILPYAGKMFQTLNESFVNLYGFVPLSDRQIKYYTKQYFSAIDPKYVCFVLDKEDEVVGFGISILSLSEALIKANGKLFPFGFVHVLKALRKNDRVDMLLQAVKPSYMNRGIPAIFFNELMQAYIDNGVKTAISSHALESNSSAYLMFKEYEQRQHLRRRIFIKKIKA